MGGASLLESVSKMRGEVVGKMINFGMKGEESKNCCSPDMEGPAVDFRRILPQLNECLFNSFEEYESFKEGKFDLNSHPIPCKPWTYLNQICDLTQSIIGPYYKPDKM